LAPVIRTLTPAIAFCGRKEEISGGKMKRKPSNEADPPRVETTILPSLAPSPTKAVIWLADMILKEVTALFPILTERVVEKFVPYILISVPLPPRTGSTEDIVGKGIKVKPFNSAVPPIFVTATDPEAPEASTASMLVGESTLKELASTPPNLTELICSKFTPLIVTEVPAPALAGEIKSTLGTNI
jgi:hypothetical protein